MSVLAAPATSIPRRVVTDRGSWAMAMFIATEAMLFVVLFFAYYYLGHAQPVWPTEPPEYKLALVMLAILLTSSGVLRLGELAAERGREGVAKMWTALTVLIGLIFVGIQGLEYRNHLRTLTPATDAYGSIFYTITSVHAAHLLLGLGMLVYVLLLPEIGPASRPPHRPLHNASLYWHFVDVAWIFIVALLYIAPNVHR